MAGDLGKDAACCRAGKEWEGEPAGKVIKIAGLDAYVSEPKQAKAGKAVLMIPGATAWPHRFQARNSCDDVLDWIGVLDAAACSRDVHL